MSSPATTVNQTLTIYGRDYLKSILLYALFTLVPGVIALAISDPASTSGQRGIVAGLLLVGVAIAIVVWSWLRRQSPARPAVVLSPAGIRAHLTTRKEMVIPWNEVQGVETLNLGRFDWLDPPHRRLRDVTAVYVSRQFFERRMDASPMVLRVPHWSVYFKPIGEKVRVLLPHATLEISAEDMRQAIEQRWRAFSSHPNAKLPAVPHAFGQRTGWPFGWKPSRTVKGVAVAALSLAMLPAVYYWHWLAMTFWFPQINADGGNHYLRDLLDKKAVQARVGNGPVAELRSFDVAGSGPVQCVREIAPDPAAGSNPLPVYKAASYCTAELKHRSGAMAMAIFRLESQRFSWTTWDDKEQPYYALVAVALAPEEADRRLCRLGSCAADRGR